MPIYEYGCRSCDAVTTALLLSSNDANRLRCSGCDGKSLIRVPSTFALHKTEAQRTAALDGHAARNDALGTDARNVGLWAKKRARELGATLGTRFDETLERARTSRHVEDLDS